MFKVSFHNVGRDKASWTEEMEEASDEAILEAIRKRRVLKSREVSLEWRHGRKHGFIAVGGWRWVGEVEIQNGEQMVTA